MRAWRRILALILLVSPACTESLREGPVEVGDVAPPVNLQNLIQCPDDAPDEWESLRGKVVVLEFMTTWCAPCRIAIPHLAELWHEYEPTREVVFIAVSNEPREIVLAFLERDRRLDTWVVAEDTVA